MKRTSALPVAALAVAITFGAAACGDDGPNASNDSATTEAPDGTAEVPEAGGPTVETATLVLVGLTEDEATEAAEALGWEVRVIRRDGEDLPMTMDLRTNRVNVEVTDGEVTEVLQIG
jgi:hypothetical protein